MWCVIIIIVFQGFVWLGHPFAGFLVSSSQPKGWLNWLTSGWAAGSSTTKETKEKKKKIKQSNKFMVLCYYALKKIIIKKACKKVFGTHTQRWTHLFSYALKSEMGRKQDLVLWQRKELKAEKDKDKKSFALFCISFGGVVSFEKPCYTMCLCCKKQAE